MLVPRVSPSVEVHAECAALKSQIRAADENLRRKALGPDQGKLLKIWMECNV